MAGMGFPGSSAAKNLPANAGDAGDTGLIPGLGKSPGEGNGNPLQYFCMENSMDRGVWQVTVHRVTKSRTQLTQDLTHMHAHVQTSERGFVLFIFKKFI